jgi:hypothetical protein
MSRLSTTVAFVYDFLADDGWELLVGLAIVLPLTYVLSARSQPAAALLLLAGVLATITISLARKLPRQAG